MRAVGADQVAAFEFLGLAVHRRARDDLVVVLADLGHLRAEMDVDQAGGARLLEQDRREIVLLALQAVGMPRVVLDRGRSNSHPFAGAEMDHLPAVGGDAELDVVVGDADLVQHVERRRMHGRGAQVARRLRRGFQQDRGDAGAGQADRCNQADRAGPDNDDTVSIWHCFFLDLGLCKPRSISGLQKHYCRMTMSIMQ